jgi:hypothetical protein
MISSDARLPVQPGEGIRSHVSFKSQFSASRDKAHNRNIATKIHEQLSQLRAGVDASPTTAKRWVWELIQNSKDVSIEGKVRVLIEADLDGGDAHVTFKHNGGAFSPENIRFLIEQVSSKERTNDSTGRPTTTGRFGTGFLTTHLLSERVVVRGVAEGRDFAPKRFKLSLDRSGAELEDIIDAVDAAQNSILGLDDQPDFTGYVPGKFNTAFRYELADKTGKNVARAGLADLDTCLPYTLSFVREIESVEYSNRRLSLEDAERKDGEVQILSVTAADPEEFAELDSSSIAVLSSGLTTIAVPVKQTADGVGILPLGHGVPRLFCDFPLLGTEAFPFPVVINNPTFYPTEARDGVFLARTDRPFPPSEHNKGIIEEAVALYLMLLDHASQHEWQHLYLLAAVKPVQAELARLDEKWYTTKILKPMRDTLLHTKIVRTAAGNVAPIHSADGSTNIWFPSGSTDKVRRAIWRCCKTWIPGQLPAQSEVEVWNEIIWHECNKLTFDQVAAFIEDDDTVQTLAGELSEEKDVHEWLNELYAALKLSEPDFLAVVAKRRIFPNQNGTFKKKADLSRDAGDIDTALLDILKLLGNDLRDHLLDPAIDTVFDDLAQKGGSFVVNQITAAVDKLIIDRNAMEHYRPAVTELLRWFHDNPPAAKKHFPILYENKHRLYDDAEILDNIKQADQLKQLLSHFKVKTVDELHAVIEKQTGASKLLPVTQQIIASLGITSVEEWKKALEDKNLAALFAHQSTPTTDMFVYAQTLIQQAKDRVIAHLSTLPQYDVSAIDETAVTVLAGVKHDGRDVQIVVRPAYDGTVIIYYQSEKDVLDYEDYELWVDTGKDVRRITFGHILKTTQIRRFPI